MTPELQYIELIFENCDFIRIPSSCVDGMGLEEISNYLWSNSVGQLIEENVCKRFEVILNYDALKIQTHFESIISDGKDNFKNHLDIYKDITHISIIQNNKEAIYVAVPWESGNHDDTINLLQKTIYGESTFTISCDENNKE
jgi:hypothetical protein